MLYSKCKGLLHGAVIHLDLYNPSSPPLPSLPSPFLINLGLQFWCHSFLHKFQVIGSKSKVAVRLHLSFAWTSHLCCTCTPCLKIKKKNG